MKYASCAACVVKKSLVGAFKDCADCRHEKEASNSEVCRVCWDDPARPNWQPKEQKGEVKS
jgi:hypothetical protein